MVLVKRFAERHTGPRDEKEGWIDLLGVDAKSHLQSERLHLDRVNSRCSSVFARRTLNWLQDSYFASRVLLWLTCQTRIQEIADLHSNAFKFGIFEYRFAGASFLTR